MRLVIEPGRASANYWRDLWRYRELWYFLAWRDIAVRYKQTVIGVAWVLLRPALTMAAFLGFRRLAGFEPQPGIPEPIFVFAAVLPWQFVSTAISEASVSLLGNANLLAKVYFPRLLVPLGAITATLVDFAVTLGILAALLAVFRVPPTPALLAIPALTALCVVFALGCGAWLAALNVKYRDFRFIVPFLLQIGLFVSPVAFASANVPARWQPLYQLNPMVGIIDGFRWAVVGGADFPVRSLANTVAITGVLCLVGIAYFRRTERGFADVI